MRSSSSVVVSLLACVACACGSSQVQPVVASSAGSAGYAIGYPARLSAEAETLSADRQRSAELAKELPGRVDELKEGADPELVYLIARQADEAGRSEAYGAASAQARELQAFWEEERGPLTARVNGAAQKQVAGAGCSKEPDLAGPITYALKDGFDKQLEKRLRERGEAHRTIERNKEALGRGNVALTEKLADDIALSSYLVNVALVRDRDRVGRLLSERGDVDSTLGQAIEWERGYQQADHTPAEKKASQEEVAALEQSRAAIPAAAKAAETALQNIDRQIEDARKAHEAALAALRQALESRRAEAPK